MKVQGNTTENRFGIRYGIFNSSDRIITKEKFFNTEESRTKFIEKASEKDNFAGVEAYFND